MNTIDIPTLEAFITEHGIPTLFAVFLEEFGIPLSLKLNRLNK